MARQGPVTIHILRLPERIRLGLGCKTGLATKPSQQAVGLEREIVIMIKLHDMPELAIPEADILQGEKRDFIAIYRLDLALPGRNDSRTNDEKKYGEYVFHSKISESYLCLI